mmetsp:Transcript_51369/g.137105  ORF Transcript_51369/g.137105 Transcript_51369/m.137105 type:complete len:214 (-) Transcript_51369:1175-1816(-)
MAQVSRQLRIALQLIPILLETVDEIHQVGHDFKVPVLPRIHAAFRNTSKLLQCHFRLGQPLGLVVQLLRNGVRLIEECLQIFLPICPDLQVGQESLRFSVQGGNGPKQIRLIQHLLLDEVRIHGESLHPRVQQGVDLGRVRSSLQQSDCFVHLFSHIAYVLQFPVQQLHEAWSFLFGRFPRIAESGFPQVGAVIRPEVHQEHAQHCPETVIFT